MILLPVSKNCFQKTSTVDDGPPESMSKAPEAHQADSVFMNNNVSLIKSVSPKEHLTKIL
ncbi:hypothetical protein DPMN_074219 [Dreissena polymorpha]|uniref:Uncharacterized protein n=1 Tax=Dreissena polymorpha TaxID=45954 RepID=A0A9D3YI72_DREPO|nr:hypothetical protein DPMN_074219 [Dreissena polymorpha]